MLFSQQYQRRDVMDLCYSGTEMEIFQSKRLKISLHSHTLAQIRIIASVRAKQQNLLCKYSLV